MKLGEVPDGVEGDLQFNTVLLKRKCACRYTYPYKMMFGEIDPLQLQAPPDTVSYDLITRKVRRYIDFVVPFEKNKYDYAVTDVQPMLDSVAAMGRSITSIAIRAFASVEGSTELNEKLQTRRAEAIFEAIQSQQEARISLRKTALENWTDFRRVSDSADFRFFRRLSRQATKDTLATDKVLLQRLEPLLATHRRAEIRIYLSETHTDSLRPEKLPALLGGMVTREHPDSAHFVQSEMLRAWQRDELSAEIILATEFPPKTAWRPLIFNQYWLASQTGQYELLKRYDRHEKRLKGLWKNYLPHRFWKTVIALEVAPDMMRGNNRLPRGIMSDIAWLEKQGLDTAIVTRMRLNY
ncbi:MAG: hypothetical protein AAF570_27290, partial [Bacteroidota bacterium]